MSRFSRRNTPKDTTEFEREQLRFLLARSDIAVVLAEINPSLAWLPVLAELNLINANTHLAPWIEKNFASVDAVREVAANIHFFGPDAAEVLELRLNQREGIPPLLVRCWRLIIRYISTANRGGLRFDWFDIAPRLKRGEHSPELFERVANVLRPKLKIGKRISWHDEIDSEPEQPSDLISIDYEIDDSVTGDEVLSTWPEHAPAEVDGKLLTLLANALEAALDDAIEAGVESSFGYGVSDRNVPSVAIHPQNAHRSGFYSIVRVIADLWERLARKDPESAIVLVTRWKESPLRLMRRLALFAAADPAVPADTAARILMMLPARELFLANSSVEVYRLITIRWSDFRPHDRQKIERRIVEGPPADSFRQNQDDHIDRSRFDLLGHIVRTGVRLGSEAQATYDDIRKRWPLWEQRPAEQAGFHFWIESGDGIVGDPAKLDGVPDDQLISAAKKAADEADFREGDTWRALCETDPIRALRGLAEEAAKNQWSMWAWQPFLGQTRRVQDTDNLKPAAQLLLKWPNNSFSKIVTDVSSWLNSMAKTLDEDLVWLLWDRIAAVSLQMDEANNEDAISASINDPSGHLAEILLKKLIKGSDGQELPEQIKQRLGNLMAAKGEFGRLARVRLARDASFLFERAPKWTEQNIVPLFDWSSPDAHAMWSARRDNGYIGSPKLFALTKQPFLEIFKRPEISAEELQVFADWLGAIMIANKSDQADYPITHSEARSSLRRAGVKSLSIIGHRLAVEMGRAKPEEKISKWRDVVGPVFQSIWPLDIELQTSESTFKLVQILRESGDAFPEAAEVIVPFIRPDSPGHYTSLYSISKADDALYSSSPEKMLDLIAALADQAAVRSDALRKALDRIRHHAPALADTRKFQRLLDSASNV